VAFTQSLGCYDRVLPYDAVDQLSPVGHDALREVWLDVLAGRSAPRTGHVLTF